jgi:hypothetical protein
MMVFSKFKSKIRKTYNRVAGNSSPESAVNSSSPVRGGQEAVAQTPITAQPSAQGRGQGPTKGQESASIAQSADQPDEHVSVAAARKLTTLVPPLPSIASLSNSITAPDLTRFATQSAGRQLDRASADAGPPFTTSTPSGLVVVGPNADNETPEPATKHPEPSRLTCWEKAANGLKPEVSKKLQSMEKKIKEMEENFTLKDPPDLLKMYEKKKRKTGGMPLWAQSIIRGILFVKDILNIAAAFDPHKAAPAALKGFCVILEVRLCIDMDREGELTT